MTQARGDLSRALLHAKSKLLEAVPVVAGHWARHADGGGHFSAFIQDRGCNADGAELRLLVVHRIALVLDFRQLSFETRKTENRTGCIALECQRGQYFLAIVRRQERQDGFPERGTVEGTAHTWLRNHAESVGALHNVEIENIVAIQHAKVDGFFGNAG